jgi:hypothetical protein
MAKKLSISTPWGPAESAKAYGDGITFYSTASHGGFFVRPDLLDRIPSEWVQYGAQWSHGAGKGWFEEDCAWAAVALCFPERFSAEALEIAARFSRSMLPYPFSNEAPLATAKCASRSTPTEFVALEAEMAKILGL